jgi:hypothetical protein
MKTKIFIIIVILILCNLSPSVTSGFCQKSDTAPSDENSMNQQIPFFMFHQYLSVEYDRDFAYNASYVPGGPPVYIPLQISYWTDIPEVLLKIPFRYVLNLLLFGKFFGTQTIYLDVAYEPEWAVITFSNATVSFEIEDGKQIAYTDLIITCLENAPSTPSRITFEARAPSLLLLSAYVYPDYLSFMPQYVPCLSIDWDTNVITPPLESTNISINITNCGNWDTRVRAYILEYPDTWGAVIYSTIIILKNETFPMTLTVIPPKDFHGIETITLKFTTQKYPSLGETGDPYIIQISVHYP